MGCVKKTCAAGIDPGALRTLVEIHRQILSDDGAGGQIRSVLSIGSFYASVKQKSGREVYTDEQLREEGDHEISTRWETLVAYSLVVTDRLVIDGVKFQIRSIQNVQYENTVALILAERGVPA